MGSLLPVHLDFGYVPAIYNQVCHLHSHNPPRTYHPRPTFPHYLPRNHLSLLPLLGSVQFPGPDCPVLPHGFVPPAPVSTIPVASQPKSAEEIKFVSAADPVSEFVLTFVTYCILFAAKLVIYRE